MKNRKFLHSAGDVEGHLGKDKRFYLIDFSRTFPPSDPDTNIHMGPLLLSSSFDRYLRDIERYINNLSYIYIYIHTRYTEKERKKRRKRKGKEK